MYIKKLFKVYCKIVLFCRNSIASKKCPIIWMLKIRNDIFINWRLNGKKLSFFFFVSSFCVIYWEYRRRQINRDIQWGRRMSRLWHVIFSDMSTNVQEVLSNFKYRNSTYSSYSPHIFALWQDYSRLLTI